MPVVVAGLPTALAVDGSGDFAAGVAADDGHVSVGGQVGGGQRSVGEVEVLQAGPDGAGGCGVDEDDDGSGGESIEDRFGVEAGLDGLVTPTAALSGADGSGVEVGDAVRLGYPGSGRVAPHGDGPGDVGVGVCLDRGGDQDQLRRRADGCEVLAASVQADEVHARCGVWSRKPWSMSAVMAGCRMPAVRSSRSWAAAAAG